MSSPTDFVGNPITVGCHICYPVRQGSGMWQKRIKVTGVSPNRITGTNLDHRVIHITNLGNVAVINVPEAKPDAVPANEEQEDEQGMA